jgi:hypothetical protein
MYKHKRAAWLTARQAIGRDYYAANDAKELLITADPPACSVFHYTFAVGVGIHNNFSVVREPLFKDDTGGRGRVG